MARGQVAAGRGPHSALALNWGRGAAQAQLPLFAQCHYNLGSSCRTVGGQGRKGRFPESMFVLNVLSILRVAGSREMGARRGWVPACPAPRALKGQLWRLFQNCVLPCSERVSEACPGYSRLILEWGATGTPWPECPGNCGPSRLCCALTPPSSRRGGEGLAPHLPWL